MRNYSRNVVKKHICLANRFVSILRMEKVIAKRLVGKCIPFIQILGPDHIGHVVTHAPEYQIEVFILPLLLKECIFTLFAFCNISNISQAVGDRTLFVSYYGCIIG